MNLSGWGRFPKVNLSGFKFDDLETLEHKLKKSDELISFGNGRSYGDSALNDEVVFVKPYGYFLDFDESTGLLSCQAGVLLADIVEFFVPRGWFLKVTPGTKYVTLGGAIASDVHGKNHHVQGCFSSCVKEFRLMLPDGSVKICSEKKNINLYRATCGGMGLTGVILDAKIYLKKIHSRKIKQTTIKSNNLKETFEAFKTYGDAPYSVAWIDCLAQEEKLGRSLLMVGDFHDDGDLIQPTVKQKKLPFEFPSFVLNSYFVKAFNWLYFNKVRKKKSNQMVDLEQFFYPLDHIEEWNKMYGKRGFVQYQFILPLESSFNGLQEILTEISNSGMGSFLAVLKLYGPENNNYLSFPLEGYSLALDFKMKKGLFDLLDRLDQIVLKYSGRIYLAKDARVSKRVFQQGYPKISQFLKIREQYAMNKKFHSLQSKRLGL